VIKEVRDEVKRGTLLSEAFRRQGVFPPIYVTSVMAGEKSGALGEVLDRYINYQRWRWRCGRRSCCRCCIRRF
jgi:type IV pilus assembly protein PilC